MGFDDRFVGISVQSYDRSSFGQDWSSSVYVMFSDCVCVVEDVGIPLSFVDFVERGENYMRRIAYVIWKYDVCGCSF